MYKKAKALLLADEEHLKDIDYIRACIEIDPQFAIDTIPALHHRKLAFYYLEKEDSVNETTLVLKSMACTREEFMGIMLENKLNIVSV